MDENKSTLRKKGTKGKKSLDRNNGKMKWNKVARKEENRKKKHQELVFW